MEINYIILAHKNPEQLARLVNRLNAEDTFFYIHIDKKMNTTPFEELLNQYSNVFFLEENKRVSSLWGSFGLVQATLNGMHKVLDDNRKGYTVLLSGQDYPLKGNEYIRNFFCENYGFNFISGTKMPAAHWKEGGMNRIEKYHFIMSDTISHFYKLPWIFSKRYKFPPHFTFKKFLKVVLRHKLNAFQILFKRKYPLKLIPYGGNAWFAFPAETVQFICDYIKKHQRYMQFHRFTMLPDEIFFHTLIYNHFKKIKEEVHCIDWSRLDEPLPVVFKKDDLEQLQHSGKLFARKFDYDIDKEILDLIDEALLSVSSAQ